MPHITRPLLEMFAVQWCNGFLPRFRSSFSFGITWRPKIWVWNSLLKSGSVAGSCRFPCHRPWTLPLGSASLLARLGCGSSRAMQTKEADEQLGCVIATSAPMSTASRSSSLAWSQVIAQSTWYRPRSACIFACSQRVERLKVWAAFLQYCGGFSHHRNGRKLQECFPVPLGLFGIWFLHHCSNPTDQSDPEILWAPWLQVASLCIVLTVSDCSFVSR